MPIVSDNLRSSILRIYHYTVQIISKSYLLSDPQKLAFYFAMIAQKKINRWTEKKIQK